MKWYRNLLLIVLGAGALYFGRTLEWKQPTMAQEDNLLRMEEASGSIVYILNQQNWTRFHVDSNTPELKGYFNANLESGTPQEMPIAYRVDFQFRTLSGKILEQGTWWQNALVNHEEETLFYNKVDLEPAPTRQIHWQTVPKGAEELWVKLGKAETGIRDVAMRLYQPHGPDTVTPDVGWRRLNPKDRQQMARDNVFGHGQLRAGEKEQLLLTRPKPKGPLGIEDKNYHTRTLYRQTRLPSAKMPATSYPARGRIVIKETKDFHLKLSKGEGQLSMIQFKGGQEASRRSIPLDGRTVELKADDEAMWVLEPDQDTHLSFNKPLQPTGVRTKVYVLDASQPLTYQLFPHKKENTPFRLHLRGQGTVHYRLLDAQQQLVGEDTIQVQQARSAYDHVAPTRERVFEAQRMWFRLPPTVASIHLQAGTPFLTNGFSRPNVLDESIQPQSHWFALKPANSRELKDVVLRLQERPQIEEPKPSYGPVKPLTPQGDWLGDYLLLAREKGDLSTMRSNAYAPIKVGTYPNQRFLGAESECAPTLAYWGRKGKPQPLRVWIDNHLVMEEMLGLGSGEMPLPLMTTGKHHLKIEGPENLLMAMTHIPLRDSFMRKRMGYQLNRSSTFSVNKQTPQVRVSGRFYWPGKKKRAPVLEIQIVNLKGALKPDKDFSFHHKRIQLEKTQNTYAFILGGSGQRLKESEPFFMVLRDDLPQGSYRVRVRQVSGEKGFLVLNQSNQNGTPL